MQLKYRSEDGPTRQHALPRREEQRLADQGEDYIQGQLYDLLIELSKLTPMSFWQHPQFVRANSLVWIWAQMRRELIQGNIRILMARQNITSINQLANKMNLNASFVSRLLKMEESIDFGGWNVEQVFKLSAVLDARPELMLTTDLKSRVSDEVVNALNLP